MRDVPYPTAVAVGQKMSPASRALERPELRLALKSLRLAPLTRDICHSVPETWLLTPDTRPPAPASRHLTPSLLQRLERRGVERDGSCGEGHLDTFLGEARQNAFTQLALHWNLVLETTNTHAQ